MAVASSDFIHPEDMAALENLRAVPLFPTFTKAFVAALPEHLLHGLDLANKVRLGPDQLPDIYRLLPPICAALGVEEPGFFLEMDPEPNAYTTGDTRTFLTVTSGLVQALEERELRAVLAHECGHIACHHVLYHTMADMLAKFGPGLLGLLGQVVEAPVQLALMHWSRRSELSADRAAALVTDPDTVATTMVRLAGGPAAITGAINFDAYLKQAEDYEALAAGSNWDRILQQMALARQDHPFLATRAREVRRWSETEQFRILVRRLHAAPGTLCPHCGADIDAGWKFCRACGAPLTPAVSQAAS